MHPQRTYSQAEGKRIFGAVEDFLKMAERVLPIPRKAVMGVPRKGARKPSHHP